MILGDELLCPLRLGFYGLLRLDLNVLSSHCFSAKMINLRSYNKILL